LLFKLILNLSHLPLYRNLVIHKTLEQLLSRIDHGSLVHNFAELKPVI
jgi:hypothetical protein